MYIKYLYIKSHLRGWKSRAGLACFAWMTSRSLDYLDPKKRLPKRSVSLTPPRRGCGASPGEPGTADRAAALPPGTARTRLGKGGSHSLREMPFTAAGCRLPIPLFRRRIKVYGRGPGLAILRGRVPVPGREFARRPRTRQSENRPAPVIRSPRDPCGRGSWPGKARGTASPPPA